MNCVFSAILICCALLVERSFS